jgi:hypothetical protein
MQYINISIREHLTNSGRATGEDSGVPISPRHESREAMGAVAIAEGKGGAGAERSSATPRSGGGIGRWRDERVCSAPWDCSARVPRRRQAVKKTGEEEREPLCLCEASTRRRARV